jgi:diguanylate cyclase (GGDEF)-like protein
LVTAGFDPLERRTRVLPADIAAALLPLHAANDRESLAAAIGSLLDPLCDDAAACAFLDDGSGILNPFVKGDQSLPQVANVHLSIAENGPVAHVLKTGEAVVLDSLAELGGEDIPAVAARRILLLPLEWENERFGILLFFDQGRVSLDVYPRLAEHVALALARLRAIDQRLRFGGIDPSRWLFDREWLRLRVEEEVDRALRYGHPLTLLLFQFQNLEEIARSAGRHQTEVFLRRVGAIVRGQIRNPDVLAGFGKASIAVLLPETEKAAAIAVQMRIASRLSKMKLVAGNEELKPVLLLAAANCPQDAQTAGDLVAAIESQVAPYEAEEQSA